MEDVFEIMDWVGRACLLWAAGRLIFHIFRAEPVTTMWSPDPVPYPLEEQVAIYMRDAIRRIPHIGRVEISIRKPRKVKGGFVLGEFIRYDRFGKNDGYDAPWAMILTLRGDVQLIRHGEEEQAIRQYITCIIGLNWHNTTLKERKDEIEFIRDHIETALTGASFGIEDVKERYLGGEKKFKSEAPLGLLVMCYFDTKI